MLCYSAYSPLLLHLSLQPPHHTCQLLRPLLRHPHSCCPGSLTQLHVCIPAGQHLPNSPLLWWLG
jgi:hypothetical protein